MAGLLAPVIGWMTQIDKSRLNGSGRITSYNVCYTKLLRAALHLRDALKRYADELRLARGLDFAVRIGINSGEVVVGKIGDDLRMDYTAQGHVVGLAQRMEQLAEPGTACLTEHTRRLVDGYFELRGPRNNFVEQTLYQVIR